MQPRVDVNETSPSGNTPLHAAVNTGNVSMVKLLISAGAKRDAWNPECEGATPLHLAIMSGKCLVLRYNKLKHCGLIFHHHTPFARASAEFLLPNVSLLRCYPCRMLFLKYKPN